MCLPFSLFVGEYVSEAGTWNRRSFAIVWGGAVALPRRDESGHGIKHALGTLGPVWSRQLTWPIRRPPELPLYLYARHRGLISPTVGILYLDIHCESGPFPRSLVSRTTSGDRLSYCALPFYLLHHHLPVLPASQTSARCSFRTSKPGSPAGDDFDNVSERLLQPRATPGPLPASRRLSPAGLPATAASRTPRPSRSLPRPASDKMISRHMAKDLRSSTIRSSNHRCNINSKGRRRRNQAVTAASALVWQRSAAAALLRKVASAALNAANAAWTCAETVRLRLFATCLARRLYMT